MPRNPNRSEKRKKLFPSRRNSCQGATIAARFFTTQSIKIKRPRAPIHMKTRMRISTAIAMAIMTGIPQAGSESDEGRFW
jgi:hypothetical protein